jgi:F420-dependent oxidoreductase-like protein
VKITVAALPKSTDPSGLNGVLEDVDAAAAAGFPRIWLPQLPPSAGMAGWDALTTLALAGARTTGIELGTSVVVAYTQHPLALARQALTASAATGGRLLLGIGVSHRFLVSDMLGYSYEAPAAFLREYLEILAPALAGDPVDHHGPRITAVGQLDLPHAAPPPLIAAALGPRMLDIAGRLTDGTVTAWTGLKTVERQIVPGISTAAEAAGRPAPQVIVGLPVSVTNDVAAARAEIGATFSPGDLPAYKAVLDVEGVDSVADICVFGDEQQVAAQLRRFADVGATEFAAHPVGDAAAVARTIDVLASIGAGAAKRPA